MAAVPASPLLLPALSPGQPAAIRDEVSALRADAAAVWHSLPPQATTVVVVAAGTEPALHDGARLDLAGYGYPGVSAAAAVDHGLLEVLATRSGVPRLRQDRLDGDLGVLTAQLAAAHPDRAVLPLTVRARSHEPALRSLSRALLDLEPPIAVVAAGDLAATLDTTSPGYLVDGALAWDQQAVAALRAGDADTLAALGPDDAGRVQARGWAPLVLLLLLAQATGQGLRDVRYRAPRGVGQVTAR